MEEADREGGEVVLGFGIDFIGGEEGSRNIVFLFGGGEDIFVLSPESFVPGSSPLALSSPIRSIASATLISRSSSSSSRLLFCPTVLR